jgi:4-amino-4-deoxy-L-arabinose transferase-like glycosyltransferase
MPNRDHGDAQTPAPFAFAPNGPRAEEAPAPRRAPGPLASAPGGAPRSLLARWRRPEELLLLLSLAMGALSHGINLFSYPLYLTDEGIYMQQAWAVLREGALSPYTYFYDHAPAGWLFIAAWVNFLPGQFQTFGNAINTGRVLMLLIHLANVALLYRSALGLSGSRMVAVVAAFLFNLSPLAIFYQRQVVLDNLMVFWLLLSLYLASRADRRVTTPMLSGLALGLAVLTKENAIFFVPALAYLIFVQVRDRLNFRFALGYWCFMAPAVVSLYFLYATLKNELFPSGFSFDLNNPPADHVSLLYTIWWQLHRSQGSILDPSSLVWQFSFGAWVPKDAFILALGGAATALNLILGLGNRKRNRDHLVAAGLAAGYAFYVLKGSVMLEFYVVPLLPFLALNIGLLVAGVLDFLPRVPRVAALAAFFGVLLFHPGWGYLLKVDQSGHVFAQDLYRLPLTEMQAEQLAFIRSEVPPDAKLIIDDDIWADLHDVRPYYKWAHSHWKASSDPDVRDKLFAKDWRNIDYIVMSNKMLETMQQNNGDHRYDWILAALDHAQQVWVLERGGVKLEVYRVQK